MTISIGPTSIVKKGLIFLFDSQNARSFITGSTTCTDVVGRSNGIMQSVGFTEGRNFVFNKTTSFIDFGADPILHSIFDAPGGTICALINPISDGEGASPTGSICDKTASSTNGWSFYVHGLSVDTASLGFDHKFSVANGVWKTSGQIRINKYSFVAVTYLNNATTTDPVFYLDGDVRATTETVTPSGTRTADTGNALVVGNISDSSKTFDGSINVLMIYRRILTATEITQNFNSLKGRWRQ